MVRVRCGNNPNTTHSHTRFLYELNCHFAKTKPDDTTPDIFVSGRVEKMKWVTAYKYHGPPCELLELGTCECHEYLAVATEIKKRGGTGTKKRKAQKLSRAAARLAKAKKVGQSPTPTPCTTLLASPTGDRHSQLALGRGPRPPSY